MFDIPCYFKGSLRKWQSVYRVSQNATRMMQVFSRTISILRDRRHISTIAPSIKVNFHPTSIVADAESSYACASCLRLHFQGHVWWVGAVSEE